MLRQHLSYYFLLDDFFLAGFFLPQFLRQPLFAECFFMSLLYHIGIIKNSYSAGRIRHLASHYETSTPHDATLIFFL